LIIALQVTKQEKELFLRSGVPSGEIAQPDPVILKYCPPYEGRLERVSIAVKESPAFYYWQLHDSLFSALAKKITRRVGSLACFEREFRSDQTNQLSVEAKSTTN